MPPISHEAYVASVPEAVRPRLTAIQAKVESLLPGATRCIGYSMPAYRGSRRIFFYFAAFKKHIGIYPPVTRDAALIAELAPYRGEKGNLTFALNQPLPIELIGRVAVALHREYDAERGEAG
jgi:uncharacterized protein YdhG (YjbR/CyaY superfamily)